VWLKNDEKNQKLQNKTSLLFNKKNTKVKIQNHGFNNGLPNPPYRYHQTQTRHAKSYRKDDTNA
jgi:hypothetical protein